MNSRASATDVARDFGKYLARVSTRGECFVLFRGKQAVAELRPMSAQKRLRELPELLASLPRLSEAEAADLAVDLGHARRDLTRPHQGWEEDEDSRS